MKKKMTAICLSIAIMLQGVVSFATYTPIYERRSEVQVLASGVTHQNIQRYTDGGWINMNVVRMKQTPAATLDIVTNETIATRSTLSQLIAKNNEAKDIVAGINTDFFDIDRNTTMGHLMKNGKLLTTGIGFDGTEEFASFNVSSAGIPYVAYMNSFKNVFTNGKSSHPIDYYNKPYLYGNVTILYDNTWTSKSYGNLSQTAAVVHEILVVDGVVKDIRQNQAPFDIPENGYVIASTGTRIAEIAPLFKVGDTVECVEDLFFRYNQLIVGGGSQIVAGGKALTTFTLNMSGRAPRTAIGVSRDRSEVILVTIDGRTSSYRGVTQQELAHIMVELGAFEAINMDGGGSTQMMTLNQNGLMATRNFPSDNTERRMYSGLVIRKNTLDNPVLERLEIPLTQKRFYIGSPIEVQVKGYDTNQNGVDIEKDDILWTHEGIEGVWKDSVFTPTATGKGKLIATYGDFKASYDIHVLGGAVKLNVSPSIAQIELGKSQEFTFSVLTDNGFTIPISPSVVSGVLSQPVGSFDPATGHIAITQKGDPSYVAFGFDGLKTHVSLHVGSALQVLEPFNTNVARFSSYPSTVQGSFHDAVLGGYQGTGAALMYDFTTETVTRAAYANFIKPIDIPFSATEIGLWVHGEGGNGNWLRGRVTDAKGNSTNITFALKVDWKGWQYVSTSLPKDFTPPFKLEQVYLVQTDATIQNKGTLYFDDITARVQASAVEMPQDTTRIKTLTDYKLPTSIANKAITMGYAALNDKATSSWVKPSDTFSIEETAQMYLIKVNNSKQSIRLSSSKQWLDLMAFFKSNPQKPVVLFMNANYYYVDALEAGLLYEQLALLSVPSMVVYSSPSDAFEVRFNNGIMNVFVPRATDAREHIKVGVHQGTLHFEISQ